MKIHYAGEIKWLGGSVLPGWAACCSGDQTMAIRERGNHSYTREEVTCRACLKMLEKNDLYARLRARSASGKHG